MNIHEPREEPEAAEPRPGPATREALPPATHQHLVQQLQVCALMSSQPPRRDPERLAALQDVSINSGGGSAHIVMSPPVARGGTAGAGGIRVVKLL